MSIYLKNIEYAVSEICKQIKPIANNICKQATDQLSKINRNTYCVAGMVLGGLATICCVAKLVQSRFTKFDTPDDSKVNNGTTTPTHETIKLPVPDEALVSRNTPPAQTLVDDEPEVTDEKLPAENQTTKQEDKRKKIKAFILFANINKICRIIQKPKIQTIQQPTGSIFSYFLNSVTNAATGLMENDLQIGNQEPGLSLCETNEE